MPVSAWLKRSIIGKSQRTCANKNSKSKWNAWGCQKCLLTQLCWSLEDRNHLTKVSCSHVKRTSLRSRTLLSRAVVQMKTWVTRRWICPSKRLRETCSGVLRRHVFLRLISQLFSSFRKSVLLIKYRHREGLWRTWLGAQLSYQRAKLRGIRHSWRIWTSRTL